MSGNPRTNYHGTYSYGYADARDSAHDELQQAEKFAANLKLKHRSIRYDSAPTANEVKVLFRSQELPFPTPSVIAGHRLYEKIRADGFKVALTGEGADELFAGYVAQYVPRYFRDLINQREYKMAIQLAKSSNLPVTSLFGKFVWDLPESLLIWLLVSIKPALKYISRAAISRNIERVRWFLLVNELDFEEFLTLHVTRTNLPMILRFADRNSMASGVEQRSPFLDYRVVEFSLNTPVNQKISSDAQGKHILRQAFTGLLPEQVVSARKKHGFGNAEQFHVNRIMNDMLKVSKIAPGALEEIIDFKTLNEGSNWNGLNMWLLGSLLIWNDCVYK
jgi:asparagine synthase (glutamine-hydrolysing)